MWEINRSIDKQMNISNFEQEIQENYIAFRRISRKK